MHQAVLPTGLRLLITVWVIIVGSAPCFPFVPSRQLFTIGASSDLKYGSPVNRGETAILEQPNHNPSTPPTVYWRVEGSLLDLTVVRPVAFFTWNAQTFAERFRRRGLIFLMALLRPFLYSTNRKFATRVVHAVLRGVTRDRLDLLGEEFFQYKLKPQLKQRGVQKVQELVQAGADVVLVSQGLEHVMCPLAQHLGVRRIVANRLEFRDGTATGRLLEPVIRPRGAFARILEENPDGRRAPKTLARQLDISGRDAARGGDSRGTPDCSARPADCAF